MRHCKCLEKALLLLILVFSFWEPFLWARWIVVVAALVLLLHAFMCKTCDGNNCLPQTEVKKPVTAKKKGK